MHRLLKFSVVGAALLAVLRVSGATSFDELARGFAAPPDDCRIMMRWWWFGPAVTKPELERELRAMQAAGIGGVEVAVVNPIALDDPAKGIRNVPYLSEEFLDALRFAGAKTSELGLRMDLTLGSGWPLGGPAVKLGDAARKLRLAILLGPSDPFGRAPIKPPALKEGESLLATLREETSEPKFVIATPTGAKNVAAALDGKGFVIDHYDRGAVERHLAAIGEPLLQALREHPPYAVFSDSLEVGHADWTPSLLEEFKRRRGYDLAPWLSALFEDVGDETGSVRRDWGRTLAELAEENFLGTVQRWAAQHGTRFRAQNYGTPPLTLSAAAQVDLPEGELGSYWRQFSPARWASSASHLYGKTVTSTETWTWLHSPAWRATPLDLKAEADLHFLQGINQLVGHGWPYSAPAAGRPGWSFYAAGNFSDHNPWWPAMPSLTRYLQRMSFLLRQGQPANDIAVYVPTDDILAGFSASNNSAWDHVSISRAVERRIGFELIPQILDAGYNFDFIDGDAILRQNIGHRVLILANVERIALPVLNRIAEFVERGGIVVALRRLPAKAPGLLEAKTDEAAIARLAQKLLQDRAAHRRLFARAAELVAALPPLLAPDFQSAPGVGFVHRRLDLGELYFVVNTTNRPVRAPARFRAQRGRATAWNPLDGAIVAHEPDVELDLAPYESRVIVFSDQAGATVTSAPLLAASAPVTIDLGTEWRVKIGDRPETTETKLRSWTDDESTRYFSGEAVYTTSVTIAPEPLAAKRRWRLTFGEGTPVDRRESFGMQALLDGPIREVATCTINGQVAGVVWCPPYVLDVTKFLRSGANEIRLTIANTAVNAVAGRPAPSFADVRARYQSDIPDSYYNDEDLRHPLPSGLFGPVKLIGR